MDLDASIQLRLRAVNAALRRSRIVFILSTFVCVSVLVSVHSAFILWRADLARQEATASRPGASRGGDAVLVGFSRISQTYLPFTAIDFRVADAPAPASFILFILSIWFYFIIRRENHVVGYLLRDTRHASPRVREAVFHGIASNLVFTTITRNDEPILDIDSRSRPGQGQPRPRLLIRLLIYLPVATIVLTILFAIALAATSPPTSLAYLDPSIGLVDLLVALAFGAAVFFACRKISRFENSTEVALRQYARTIENDPGMNKEAHEGNGNSAPPANGTPEGEDNKSQVRGAHTPAEPMIAPTLPPSNDET